MTPRLPPMPSAPRTRDETAFVALAFPSWLRWGQRSGASIDNLALAAVYPDHRHSAWSADGERFELVGTVRRCGWCGGVCGGRRTAWCGDACINQFYRVWSFRHVSLYVGARDGYRCVRCPKDFDPGGASRGAGKWQQHYIPWECDHIVPVLDGGTDDPANLRTLCHDCHVAVGYEQRAARKASLQNSQGALALDGAA